MAIIKQIEVNGVAHDIDAKYWDGHAFDDTVKLKFTVVWSQTDYNATSVTADLTKIPSVRVYYNSGASYTEGQLTANNADKSQVYLIYSPNSSGTGVIDNYDEYMAVKIGTNIFQWERIGGTGDIDLSNYVTKGTYTTGSSSKSETDNSESGITGDVNGTYKKATGTETSGSHTLTVNLGATNFSASGKVDIPGHTHSISPTTATVEIKDVSVLNGESAHTHTVTTHEHAEGVTVITGLTTTTDTFSYLTSVGTTPSISKYNYGFSATTVGNVMYSPIVQEGVLKWSTADAKTPISFNAGSVPSITNKIVVTGVTHSGTATVAGAVSAKTLTTSAGSPHSHSVSKVTQTITYVSGVTQTELGGVASNQPVTITLSGSKDYVIMGHSHGITYEDADIDNGSAIIPQHKHGMSHTHGITFS